MEAERDMYYGKTVNYVQWTRNNRDCFLDKWVSSSWLTSLSHILDAWVTSLRAYMQCFFAPRCIWNIYISLPPQCLFLLLLWECAKNCRGFFLVLEESKHGQRNHFRAFCKRENSEVSVVELFKEMRMRYVLIHCYAYHPPIVFACAEI